MAGSIEKVDSAGCYVDEATFIELWKRVCDLQERKPEFAELFFSTDDIHPDDGGGVADNAQPASFVSNTAEGGWSVSGNVAAYTGSPKLIRGNINLVALDTGVANYWAKPIIRVTETVSGRQFYFEELVMQSNTAYDGTAYYDGSFVHLSPPANPVYVVEYFNRENRTATLTPEVNSSLVLEADCITASTPTSTVPTLGTPANGDLVSDNFQDGANNAPFNLQVRVNGQGPTNWQAVVSGPYATIPNLVAGPYTLQTIDNGNGTYTHVFTGTAAISNFSGVTIIGDAPVPAGVGGTANVALYIP